MTKYINTGGISHIAQKLDKRFANKSATQQAMDTMSQQITDLSSALVTKANTDGYYDEMAVGSAEQLISTVLTHENAVYTFRTSGGSADIGNRVAENTIVGGTVVWNQLVQSTDTSCSVRTGHKYLARIGGSDTIGVSDGTQLVVTGTDNIFDLTWMLGPTVADRIYAIEQSNTGAGVSLFRNLFQKTYYAYNAGELMSVQASAKRTIGFNAYNHSTQTARLLGGHQYQITGAFTGLSFVTVDGETQSVTVLDDGLFQTAADGVLTVTGGDDSTTCVHLTHSGYRNGEYEAYQAHSYPLGANMVLRGVPKFAGNESTIYYDGDRYSYDGTVTRRFGMLDLGTLTWTYNSTYAFFMAQVPGIRRLPWAVADANPLVCSAYPFAGYNASMDSVVDVPDKSIAQRLNNETNIIVKDSAYTDAAAFKAAVSGKILVYELETPVTEAADPFQQLHVVDDFGTEEFVDERDVAVPVGHDSDYMVNLRDKLQHMPDLAGTDGCYMIQQSGTQMALVVCWIPQADGLADGTYTLKATVANGTATYSWVK